MDKRISDLLGVIRKEIGLYLDLVEHAKKKTALLAYGRIEAILESNRAEEALNADIRFLEIERKRLCSALCLSFGIRREDFTFLKLADHLERPIALELQSETILFGKILKQLNAVTQHNLRLTEKSLRYSKGLLGIIASATNPYQKTGLFSPVPFMHPTFSHRV